MSKSENLFRVLVLGGALMVGPANAAETNTNETATAALTKLLESSAPVGGLAFCARDNENTCSVDENGVATPRAGVECCWGTRCE